MNPQDFSLYDLLLRNATAQRDDLALVSEDGTESTFGQLRARVDALGTGLAAGGLEKGDRVAVLAQNFGAFFELYLACARNGLVAYPINWRWSLGEIERILERAGARAFVADAFSFDKVPASVTADTGLVFRAQFDGPPRDGWIGFDSLYAEATDDPLPEVGSADSFAVIATAAVDIVPRGAILSHGNVLASSSQEIAMMHLGPGDRNLLALPLFHIAGLRNALGIFQAGGANIVMPKFDAAKAVELIDRHHVTFLSDFPPVLANVLDAAKAAGTRLPSLRFVAGLDSPDTMERLHRETDADFWTGFGQSETSGFVTLQRVRDMPGAAGKTGILCSVKLVDDYDRDVPVGTPGEIVVRGPLVFQGYDGQPEITAHTFRGGWHHTGDIGRFDDEGYLYYVKRKPEKELIKPGGENVYPAEVETVIMELEGVTGVCVFGVPDPKWGEGIKAVIETERDDLTLETVREHVAGRIARFKRPGYADFTPELPRGEDRAVDREAVKERWS